MTYFPTDYQRSHADVVYMMHSLIVLQADLVTCSYCCQTNIIRSSSLCKRAVCFVGCSTRTSLSSCVTR